MDNINRNEARRQRILQHAQSRLDYLNGIKKSIESDTMDKGDGNIRTDSFSTTIPTATITQTTTTVIQPPLLQQEKPKELINNNHTISSSSSSSTNNIANSNISSHNHVNNTKVDSTTTISTSSNKLKSNENKKSIDKCIFNGYSNTEIIIFFLVALFVNFILRSAYSFMIFQNVLVPFFTVEIAHVVSYYKYLPSPSAQFQTFTALLRLSGISHKSLKNLMTIINFLFILIDNFVLYIFSFVFISIILSLFI